MNIYNSITHNNEATNWGGGIYMRYAVVAIDTTTIDNNKASGSGYGGGGMYIQDSNVTMKNTIISNNDGSYSGGLRISGDSTTVILRQSSFINNDAYNNGDEISTHKSPTISLINTYFNKPNNNNNIYEASNGSPTWNTCSDNLCTEAPFTGTCNAVNNGNSKLGVLCNLNLNCSANQFAPLVSVAISAPSNTCKPWQKCDAGYKRVNGDATSDATCVQCGQGQFQPFNQFIGTSCTNWKQCNNNEYSSFNGNRTSDRVCVLKQTTTTAAPTTTTAAPTTTTATSSGITTTKTVITTSSPVVVTATTSAAPVSVGNTAASAASLPPAGTTTVAPTITATAASSRSSNTANENDKEEELSNSIVNTMSTISISIVFMIVICNIYN
jgi:hypothetical protein